MIYLYLKEKLLTQLPLTHGHLSHILQNYTLREFQWDLDGSVHYEILGVRLR